MADEDLFQEFERLAKLFDDRESYLHVVLIEVIQRCRYAKMKPERHDGFYRYSGSIDITTIGSQVTKAVEIKLDWEREKKEGEVSG